MSFRMLDGREKPTALQNVVRKHFHVNSLEDALVAIYPSKVDHIAELSPIVSRLATSDRTSKLILNSAGSELGELACAVARKLKMTQDAFPVVATGGGFKSGRYLISSFSGRIKEECPRAIISVLKTEPARGALMIGSCKLHERKCSYGNKLSNLDRMLHRT
jgi:N-acetylglucosamine kinase-like BadF-type ATPase